VKPPPFEYHRPESLEETLSVFAEIGEEARVLAGGQSLMPMLALRLAQPAHLVDLNRVDELAQISAANGGLRVGAMVRQRTAERSTEIAKRCPLLGEALSFVGHVPIRNRGTVGGSVAHADPAAELPAVMRVLDAELVARSARGERTIPAAEFFRSHFTTALESDEVLVEIRIPPWPAGAGWAFEEVSRRHGDFAMAGAAAMVRVNGDGTLAEARLAFSGVGPTPVRATGAEAGLAGAAPSDDMLRAAGEEAAAGLEPPEDLHGTTAYRRHLVKLLTRRAVAAAVARAGAAS
jgi:carbon-monoxide dehydrogenase medium subunit